MLMLDLSRTPLLWEGVLGVQSTAGVSTVVTLGGGHMRRPPATDPGSPAPHQVPGHSAAVSGMGGDGRVELAPSPFSSTWTGYFQEKNLSYEALQLPGMCV